MSDGEQTAETSDEQLDPNAYELTDESEQLLRQVHHTWLHPTTGAVTRLAFGLWPKDTDGGLSTRRESLGAQTAYEEWIDQNGSLASVGTFGIPVADVIATQMRAYDDSHMPGRPTLHSRVDIRSYPGDEKQAARKLQQATAGRSWLYEGDPCTCHPSPFGSSPAPN